LLQLLVALLRYDLILGIKLPVLSELDILARSWFFPGYIFWFALGMVVGFHGPAIKAKLVAIRWGLLVVMIAAFVAGMVEWENLLRLSGKAWIGPRETLVDQVYSLAFLLVFIAFENVRLPLNKPVSDLGARSYGIYLVHTLALVYTSKVVNNFAPQLLSLQFLFQPLLVAAGLGIPLLMMWLMNRSPMRRMYGFIFG
jgi:peptidoglycan/LPS O-acetylase OafA/YrhL